MAFIIIISLSPSLSFRAFAVFRRIHEMDPGEWVCVCVRDPHNCSITGKLSNSKSKKVLGTRYLLSDARRSRGFDVTTPASQKVKIEMSMRHGSRFDIISFSSSHSLSHRILNMHSKTFPFEIQHLIVLFLCVRSLVRSSHSRSFAACFSFMHAFCLWFSWRM